MDGFGIAPGMDQDIGRRLLSSRAVWPATEPSGPESIGYVLDPADLFWFGLYREVVVANRLTS